MKMENTIYVPNDILTFKALFNQANKDLYLVGGCVRDHIMGIEPHDFDLVTNATPDEISKILSAFRTDLQGKQFGVIRACTTVCPLGYEIATYRKDISKGRDNKSESKKVEINNVTMLEDAQRRDFTMNALYYDIDNQEIIDLVGGIYDIYTKTLNTVGVAADRFNEDRLRMMRAIRFASRFGLDISDDIHEALETDHRLKYISEIDDISQERIIEEMIKMCEYCKKNNKRTAWVNYFYLLNYYGILPEMFNCSNLSIEQVDYLNQNHIDYLLPFTLYLILKDSNVNIKKLIGDFRLPTYLANEITFLIKFKTECGNTESAYELKKLQLRYAIDDDLLIKFNNLVELDSEFVNKFIKFKFSVSSEDLMQKGFSGKPLGDEIKRLELINFNML